MKPINPSEVQDALRSYIGSDVYVHGEATSYMFVRNFKVHVKAAFLAGDGPYRAALRYDDRGWLRMEALTHAELDERGVLLLAGFDDRGRMHSALHLGKEPFPE